MILQYCSVLLITSILIQANDPPVNVINAQPETIEATDLCTTSVPGFNFIRSFTFACKSAYDFEFSYVLVRKSKYNVKLCLEHPSALQIELYNSCRDKVLTFTTKKENTDAFVYECNATGIYYIKVLNKERTEASGQISLAFQKAL